MNKNYYAFGLFTLAMVSLQAMDGGREVHSSSSESSRSPVSGAGGANDSASPSVRLAVVLQRIRDAADEGFQRDFAVEVRDARRTRRVGDFHADEFGGPASVGGTGDVRAGFSDEDDSSGDSDLVRAMNETTSDEDGDERHSSSESPRSRSLGGRRFLSERPDQQADLEAIDSGDVRGSAESSPRRAAADFAVEVRARRARRIASFLAQRSGGPDRVGDAAADEDDASDDDAIVRATHVLSTDGGSGVQARGADVVVPVNRRLVFPRRAAQPRSGTFARPDSSQLGGPDSLGAVSDGEGGGPVSR